MNKEPKSIKECREMIARGEIPPLSEEEKASLIKTIKQMRNEEKMKRVEDMTDSELRQMRIDCKDTLAYVENNKEGYGMLYDTALATTEKLQKEVEEEIKKRGI